MDICTPEHHTETIVELAPSENCYDSNQKSKSSDDVSKRGILPQLENKEHKSTATATAEGKPAEGVKPHGTGIALKWKPLKGMAALQNVNVAPVTVKTAQHQKNQALSKQGVRMEIKSKSLVRPGSLFDEVRKTARLNQRPRNQESSSEEKSPQIIKNSNTSRTRSPKKSVSRKSRSASSHRSRSRGWSHSSRSHSRSRSSSYSSRSHSRSRRRRRRSRSRSSTYHSYRSRSRTYSRSHSRSRSYSHRRRSRSDSYDSYSSRSRSVSKRRRRRRSDSYRSSERSRSYHSSSRSSSRRRSHSRSSRYS